MCYHHEEQQIAKARFRRPSTNAPNLTDELSTVKVVSELIWNSRINTPNSIQSVLALYNTGAAGDSYDAPLKCRT